ncbi:MAG: cytochrome c oxidase assembly protein [Dongiaceae bacterium]
MGQHRQRSRRNRLVVGGLVGLVIAMGGLAFASVPLYRLFCQVTGYGGATQRAEAAPQAVPGKTITVRFNADIAPDLPWTFQPMQQEVTLEIGATGLAFYRVHNNSNMRLVGSATFNVTPYDVGFYFNKLECFCFQEQLLEPGQSAELPVTFFVDPEILKDAATEDVQTVTLSYTFFLAPDQSGAQQKISDAGDGAETVN